MVSSSKGTKFRETSLQALAGLPARLATVTTEYLECLRLKTDLELAMHLRKAQVLVQGRDEGLIKGPNAETREAELVLLLNGDAEYRAFEAALTSTKLQFATIDMRLRNAKDEIGIYTTLVNYLTAVAEPHV